VLLTAEISRRPSRLASVASTVRFVAKRLGWAHALLWLCATSLRRLSLHIFVVATQPFDDDQREVNAAGLEAHLLTCDEVMYLFNRDEGYGYSRAFAADALSRGDRCVGLFEHGRLVWYCWYARGAAPVFDDVEAVADWPFVYAYNLYTDSARRGCGLNEIGVNASARIFAREGYRAFSAYIEADNLPMLIAARKKGDSFVGFMILHRRIGPAPWFVTRGCRQAGFRVRRGSETHEARHSAVLNPRRSAAVPNTSPRVI
jgi:hypothetical protein